MHGVNIVPDEGPSTGAEILPELGFCYLLLYTIAGLFTRTKFVNMHILRINKSMLGSACLADLLGTTFYRLVARNEPGCVTKARTRPRYSGGGICVIPLTHGGFLA